MSTESVRERLVGSTTHSIRKAQVEVGFAVAIAVLSALSDPVTTADLCIVVLMLVFVQDAIEEIRALKRGIEALEEGK